MPGKPVAQRVKLTGISVSVPEMQHPLAIYPVEAGGELTIPLTLMHDFPAMLPLAIVLRRVE